MYFNCKFSVIIGNKEVKSVVSVSAKNDAQHIGADCDIVVPLNCRIQYTDGKRDYLTDQVKNLFKSGDKIDIKAKYEGFEWVEVFNGYVVDFIEGNPMTIKCMDYIYLLNLTTIDISYKQIKLKDLLTRILKGTGITLVNPIINFTLVNVTYRLMSPAAILEVIKKDLGLNISLTSTSLYCNIASNTRENIKLDTTRNVLKSNLQKPLAAFLKYKVKAWFLRNDGLKDSIEVGDENGQIHDVFFYNLIPRSESFYKEQAKESLLKYRQGKYSGNVDVLLYPDCDLFWSVEYKDKRYPARNGNYTVTGIDTTLNASGYHRVLKLAYLSDLI